MLLGDAPHCAHTAFSIPFFWCVPFLRSRFMRASTVYPNAKWVVPFLRVERDQVENDPSARLIFRSLALFSSLPRRCQAAAKAGGVAVGTRTGEDGGARSSRPRSNVRV